MIWSRFKASDGTYLKVGDRVRVPDNPDIVPYDEGVIEYRPMHGITAFMECSTDFLFVGKFSTTPLDFYEVQGYEIERIE